VMIAVREKLIEISLFTGGRGRPVSGPERPQLGGKRLG
jgi:hypothetical protein